MAIAFSCLLTLVVLPPRVTRPTLPVRVLETRPFLWGGVISCSVFLWHEPLVRWLREHGLTAAGRRASAPALQRKTGGRRERYVSKAPAEQAAQAALLEDRRRTRPRPKATG